MESLFALAAASASTGFVVALVRSHVLRPRPHAAAWSVAMAMYSLATWALFVGLAWEWSDGVFRVFYLFGAILNVVFLALGSVYLVLGPRVGGALLVVLAAFGAGAGAVTLTADFVAPLATSGIPVGSEVFAEPAEGIATPRLWAVVGNTVGTALLAGLAIYGVVRFWRSNRALALGNLLIVAGTVAPAVGGSLTGLGEGGLLALSLLAGAALLWWGYAVAARARRQAAEAG